MGKAKRLLAGAGVAIGFAMGTSVAFAQGNGSASGVYTKSQAEHGAEVYRENCASCHAGNLQGNVGPALVGKPFRQMAAAQNLTARSLRDVIAQSMPQTNPGGLSAGQYDAITAFILQKNGYPAGSTKLTAKEPGLKALKLAK